MRRDSFITVRVPINLKRELEMLFPGKVSEFVRVAIEKELARYSEEYLLKLKKEREELVRRLDELDKLIQDYETKNGGVSDEERVWLIENANHIVKAITSSNGNWRGELPPEEALKLVLNSFCEKFGVSFVEAKRKLLAVFPELPEEVVS